MMYKQIQWAAVFLGIVSIEVALLYKLMASQAATNPTEVIIAICIVGILFLLSPNVDGLKLISFGKAGFRAELEVLQQALNPFSKDPRSLHVVTRETISCPKSY
jgi:hypothetical protein